MAQWIPKTAWRVSNLNKRYGPSYITSGHITDNTYPRREMIHDVGELCKRLSERKDLVMIDVRDEAERQQYPVSGTVALHHFDLLSGAACPILPREKCGAELFILTSNEQRGYNSSSALHRWGYDNVFVVNYKSLMDAAFVQEKRSDDGEK